MTKSVARLRVSIAVCLFVALSAGPVRGQPLPAPWASADVGAPALAGSATHASGAFTVSAAGWDIWSTNDQFHFVYQRIDGDAEIVARVESLTFQHSWSKAGVMIRSSLNANAAHGYALVSAGNGIAFQRRAADGGTSASTAGSTMRAPAWVRAVRAGTQVTAYWSADGTAWTSIGSAAIALGDAAYFGIAVTSHNTGSRTTAVVSNVAVSGEAPPPPDPPDYESQDIGAVGVAGSAAESNGVYTITASGADIWDTADQFHFVYKPLTGDAELIARVDSISNTHTWAKAGVMIRESLTPESRHALVAASAGSGYAFQRRPDPGAFSVHTSGGTGDPPGWVRLVRAGDLFQAYRSSDGTTWTSIGSDTILMGATVYVGLAATSHNNSTASTVVISNFSVSGGSPGNQPPAVSITAPATGTQYDAPATIAIAATASDPEDRLTAVDFYANSTLIGTDATAPYTASWSTSAAGTHSLTAVAHDADGGSTTSGAVTVTVQSANAPPSVTLTSPTSGASFTSPATISLTAAASDPEGQLSRVEFFSGATLLASDTAAPYAFTWNGVGPGSYSLTAVAHDTAGASVISGAVTVTVSASNGAPSVALTSPSSGASFTAPATVAMAADATDPEGQLARVEFRSGSTILGTDTAAPYTFDWTAVPAGSYTLTAVAFDAAGASATSAARTITVTAASSGQQGADVGAPAVTGSFSETNGRFTVNAGGADIWGTADQFHFVYRQLKGNAEVVGRLVSLQNSDNWAKAGVMMRESLDAGSRNVFAAISAARGYVAQRRILAAGETTSTNGGTGAAPGWVRMVRSGNLFETFRSDDGVTWTRISADSIGLPETIYVGLAVTSHNTAAATTAVFENVSMVERPNMPPSAMITSPGPTSEYWAPAAVTVVADAVDPEDRLARVEFYNGATLLGTDTTAPYAFDWSGVAAGTYTISAVAYDTAGASGSSASVTFTVSPAPSSPPRLVSFEASTDHATNVTSYVLDIFLPGQDTWTATPVASSNLGKPTPDGNNGISVDRQAFFESLAPGTYVATVSAVGPGGLSRSASVTFPR